MFFPLLSLPILPGGIFLLGFQAQILPVLYAMIFKGRVNHFHLYILMAIST